MKTKNTKTNIKPRKVRGPSKKDKNIISNALLNNTNLIQCISSIDPDILKRSISHILNDYLDVDPTNGNIGKRSIDSFISSTDVVYRFAPAPSGDLHIGHIVPLLFNMLFAQVGKNYGRKSKILVRIDDTDPDLLTNPAAYKGVSIIDTLQMVLGSTINDVGIVVYKSSDYIDPIVNSVFDSIKRHDGMFYPDLTPRSQIKQMRADKVCSSYRNLSKVKNLDVLSQLQAGADGVIRAKIDMRSDNGNLRDPVMIRFRDGNAWPSYDIVCPFLDLYDMRRFNNNGGNGNGDNNGDYGNDYGVTLLAIRDRNYLDRYDQYAWVQKALAGCDFLQGCSNQGFPDQRFSDQGLTSMLTFSRVQMQDVLLSKRKIRALITSGVVSDWDDQRLFTIRGIMNRGITIAALCNFYWVNGIMSTSGKGGVIPQHMLYSLSDKLMARTAKPILNRIKDNISDTIICNTLYDVTIISYNDIIPNITPNILDKFRVIGTFKVDLDQIIASNLSHYRKLADVGIDYNTLNTPGVPAHDTYNQIKDLFPNIFYYGLDLTVGDIVKINNFKDDDTQGHYPGYYVLRSFDKSGKTMVFSSVSH